MSTTDHLPDAGKMMPTEQDYATDIERIIQEEERDQSELFERELVMSALLRAQAAEAAILAWADTLDTAVSLVQYIDASKRMEALAARIRAGREKGAQL